MLHKPANVDYTSSGFSDLLLLCVCMHMWCVCMYMCVYGVHTCASVECLRVYMSVYGCAYLCICGGKRSIQVSWSYALP